MYKVLHGRRGVPLNVRLTGLCIALGNTGSVQVLANAYIVSGGAAGNGTYTIIFDPVLLLHYTSVLNNSS